MSTDPLEVDRLEFFEWIEFLGQLVSSDLLDFHDLLESMCLLESLDLVHIDLVEFRDLIYSLDPLQFPTAEAADSTAVGLLKR